MATLEQRIKALEGTGGAEPVTVILVSFVGMEEVRPVSHYACGDIVVWRNPDEADESFKERALAELRGDRRGVLVVSERREAC